MPCTLPVPVVLAGAISGPVCSGTPSKPTAGSDALVEVAAPEEVPVPEALDVPVAAALDVPVAAELELEFDDPHAASANAHNSAVERGIRGRIGLAKVAGWSA